MQASSHEFGGLPLPVRQGLADGSRQSTAHLRMLPVEIGFLAHHGYPPDALHKAAILASRAGVTPDMFLIKGGYVGESDFYRALAAELALPFTSAPRLSAQARFPDAIMSGLAPSLSGGFVMAPQGSSLAWLLRKRRSMRSPVAVTTPTRLARAVFGTQARRIAYRCANELPDRAPDLSNRDQVSPGQILILSATALLLSFCGGLFPEPTLTALGVALGPLFLSGVTMRLATAMVAKPVKPATQPPRASDASLPVYTVIVALYREKKVVPGLIAALTALDCPPAKLDIKLVLEADDRETPAALAAVRLPAFIEVIVAPSGIPRTKPRALNIALPLARGHFTVVYDAEDVPDPDQLRLAVATFSRLPRNVACLQARLTIDNTDDSWLTRLFTIEYATLFDVFNPGLSEIGSPIALGGTSNHFRTPILKRIFGWDAWNVTEDADLGIRLARLGYLIEDLPSSTNEEAPRTLRAWMHQRTRWMKGYMQTCISHSRQPGRTLSQLRLWRFIGAAVLTLGTVLSALLYPLFTVLTALLWFREPVAAENSEWARLLYSGSLALFVSGVAAVFIPAIVALKRRGLWRLLPWLPVLPVYYVLVSCAAWRGLWELTVAPFRWNKTSHGLARTSRAGLLQKHQARPARTRSLKTEPP
ncbi:glycosyltransferase family 2 protein [Microvirga lenta]|uniref:glycosyltransferase family 2 protein n=1 Tax=Microvirga lenta TaxID=2881337 RepID=UPI001CFFD721|nr:glycosyltransferase family 2 protein [Microvirga lenta]MCB5175613.1 glycosyltransferase [Microvirga lenta]